MSQMIKDLKGYSNEILAYGIKDFFNFIKEKGTKSTIKEIAESLNMGYSRLTRAGNPNEKGDTFNNYSRAELLTYLVKASGLEIELRFDDEKQKIIFIEVKKEESDNGVNEEHTNKKSSVNKNIYKVYYWRGGDYKVGVGLMIVDLRERELEEGSFVDRQSLT